MSDLNKLTSALKKKIKDNGGCYFGDLYLEYDPKKNKLYYSYDEIDTSTRLWSIERTVTKELSWRKLQRFWLNNDYYEAGRYFESAKITFNPSPAD